MRFPQAEPDVLPEPECYRSDSTSPTVSFVATPPAYPFMPLVPPLDKYFVPVRTYPHLPRACRASLPSSLLLSSTSTKTKRNCQGTPGMRSCRAHRPRAAARAITFRSPSDHRPTPARCTTPHPSTTLSPSCTSPRRCPSRGPTTLPRTSTTFRRRTISRRTPGLALSTLPSYRRSRGTSCWQITLAGPRIFRRRRSSSIALSSPPRRPSPPWPSLPRRRRPPVDRRRRNLYVSSGRHDRKMSDELPCSRARILTATACSRVHSICTRTPLPMRGSAIVRLGAWLPFFSPRRSSPRADELPVDCSHCVKKFSRRTSSLRVPLAPSLTRTAGHDRARHIAAVHGISLEDQALAENA